MAARASLLIGDVAALTGISAGRIRHYETRGLLAPTHLESGYRTFHPSDVLRLLHIDLLRSLGMGLDEIAQCSPEEPQTVHQALRRHREALAAEHRRLDALLAAVDAVLDAPLGDQRVVVERLATSHRNSLGVVGRLTRPLSAAAEGVLSGVLGSWQLPVPPLFGQMLLPEPVNDLLEALAAAPGHAELFARLHRLADEVVAFAGSEAELERQADAAAERWVAEQLADPLPPAVEAALASTGPPLLELPVVRRGLATWTASLPAAGRTMATVERLAAAHGRPVLGVILLPPRG